MLIWFQSFGKHQKEKFSMLQSASAPNDIMLIVCGFL